jgi:cell division septation protein DedD
MAKKSSQSRKGGEKRYRIEVTSFTLLLWGFCALFFVAWIFVLGILVGGGFLPGADSAILDMKNQIAKLQDMASRNKRTEPEPQKEESIDEMLAFYERLESKKEEAKKRDPGAPAAKNGSKNGEIPKPAQEEVKSAPPSGSGGYTLQVASLEAKEKAEAMVRDLASRGCDAYLYEARVKGKTYFRVRCGRFATRDEASVYAAKLLKETKMRGFVSKVE